jgi:hypothetical protein
MDVSKIFDFLFPAFSIRSREVILASNRDEEDPDGDQVLQYFAYG